MGKISKDNVRDETDGLLVWKLVGLVVIALEEIKKVTSIVGCAIANRSRTNWYLITPQVPNRFSDYSNY